MKTVDNRGYCRIRADVLRELYRQTHNMIKSHNTLEALARHQKDVIRGLEALVQEKTVVTDWWQKRGNTE